MNDIVTIDLATATTQYETLWATDWLGLEGVEIYRFTSTPGVVMLWNLEVPPLLATVPNEPRTLADVNPYQCYGDDHVFYWGDIFGNTIMCEPTNAMHITSIKIAAKQISIGDKRHLGHVRDVLRLKPEYVLQVMGKPIGTKRHPRIDLAVNEARRLATKEGSPCWVHRVGDGDGDESFLIHPEANHIGGGTNMIGDAPSLEWLASKGLWLVPGWTPEGTEWCILDTNGRQADHKMYKAELDARRAAAEIVRQREARS